MVDIGFICEGDTEVKIVKSEGFQALLGDLELRCIYPIEDADGNCNLLPHKLEPKRNKLKASRANCIVVLTDLDKDESVRATKQRITETAGQHIVVAVKEAESWFLASSIILSIIVGEPVWFEQPEHDDEPFETIRQLFLEKTGRGVGTKPILARRMLKYGFTIQQAAEHPNCPSARYFLTTLQTLASAN
ncbi:MAG: hypothetical protein EAZ91_11650 [Cytophagales bacterium]|nr:MAG: hypothetical protein EAZ91_11650 [Cytophagales bacterium]